MDKLIESKAVPQPASFGGDTLSHFLNSAQCNTYAYFVHKQDDFNRLLALDHAFRVAIDNISQEKDVIYGMLLMRCHSTFLNASRLLMSGATTETFVLLRSSLEIALYALHLDTAADACKTWLSRNDGAESLEKCKKELSYRNVLRTLKRHDLSLSKVIGELYNVTIDFGAHPNQMSVTSNATIKHAEDKVHFNLGYLAGDQLSLQHAQKRLLQTSVGALSVFEIARKERFRILGVSATLADLKREL